jgi:hypothetical protein
VLFKKLLFSLQRELLMEVTFINESETEVRTNFIHELGLAPYMMQMVTGYKNAILLAIQCTALNS